MPENKKVKPRLDCSCFTLEQLSSIEKYVNDMIEYKMQSIMQNLLYLEEKDIKYK